MVINSLYDLVNDAMTHGEDGLSRVFIGHPLKEINGALYHEIHLLHIFGEVQSFEFGNKAPREVAPVALSQQRGGHNIHVTSTGDDEARVNGSSQIARNECVKMDATFKAKAKKDAEFKKYKNRPDFKDIVR